MNFLRSFIIFFMVTPLFGMEDPSQQDYKLYAKFKSAYPTILTDFDFSYYSMDDAFVFQRVEPAYFSQFPDYNADLKFKHTLMHLAHKEDPYPPALYLLGILNVSGWRIIPQNYRTGKDYLTRGADLGHPQSQYELAMLYLRQAATPCNVENKVIYRWLPAVNLLSSANQLYNTGFGMLSAVLPDSGENDALSIDAEKIDEASHQQQPVVNNELPVPPNELSDCQGNELEKGPKSTSQKPKHASQRSQVSPQKPKTILQRPKATPQKQDIVHQITKAKDFVEEQSLENIKTETQKTLKDNAQLAKDSLEAMKNDVLPEVHAKETLMSENDTFVETVNENQVDDPQSLITALICSLEGHDEVTVIEILKRLLLDVEAAVAGYYDKLIMDQRIKSSIEKCSNSKINYWWGRLLMSLDECDEGYLSINSAVNYLPAAWYKVIVMLESGSDNDQHTALKDAKKLKVQQSAFDEELAKNITQAVGLFEQFSDRNHNIVSFLVDVYAEGIGECFFANKAKRNEYRAKLNVENKSKAHKAQQPKAAPQKPKIVSQKPKAAPQKSDSALPKLINEQANDHQPVVDIYNEYYKPVLEYYNEGNYATAYEMLEKLVSALGSDDAKFWVDDNINHGLHSRSYVSAEAEEYLRKIKKWSGSEGQYLLGRYFFKEARALQTIFDLDENVLPSYFSNLSKAQKAFSSIANEEDRYAQAALYLTKIYLSEMKPNIVSYPSLVKGLQSLEKYLIVDQRKFDKDYIRKLKKLDNVLDLDGELNAWVETAFSVSPIILLKTAYSAVNSRYDINNSSYPVIKEVVQKVDLLVSNSAFFINPLSVSLDVHFCIILALLAEKMRGIENPEVAKDVVTQLAVRLLKILRDECSSCEFCQEVALRGTKTILDFRQTSPSPNKTIESFIKKIGEAFSPAQELIERSK